MKISIQRLEHSGITTESLVEMLRGQGFDSTQYTIDEHTLISNNIELIVLVNRLKAFYNKTESMPYFLLTVKGKQGESVPCVTTDPWKFKPDYHWSEDPIDVPQDKYPLVEECRVSDAGNECFSLSRQRIRETYFKPDGGLDIDKFARLSEDKNFIYCLLKKGFYASVNDEAGYLFIE